MPSGAEPTDTDLEEEIARLEQVVHQNMTSLSTLRTKRNAHRSVFRLLPEILELVFTHAAHDYHMTESGGSINPRLPSWVNVSYVCRHWRNVALNCPTLWGYHFNVSPRWTEEILHRSRQAPLKISIHHLSIQGLWFVHFPLGWNPAGQLLEHSERIRELRLCPCYLPDFLPLPPLTKLEVENTGNCTEGAITSTNCADEPSLRSLCLLGCSFPWHSLNLSGLCSLSLQDIRIPSRLFMSNFLRVLSSMQGLSFLHLEDALSSARGFLCTNKFLEYEYYAIVLPRLTGLAIVAPLSAVVALLSCIHIPSNSQLRLNPQSERGTSIGDYNMILLYIAHKFSAPKRSPPITFRSLIMHPCDSSPSLTLSTLDRDTEPHLSSLTLGDWDHHIPLVIILGEGAGSGEPRDVTNDDKQLIMNDIFRALPLTHVRSLHVIEPRISTAFWRVTLGGLAGLRYMKLSEGSMPNLSLLSQENPIGQPTRDRDPTPGHTFVPALEEMELCHITFIPDDGTSQEHRMSQVSFLDALSTRNGLRDRLTMIECKVGLDG